LRPWAQRAYRYSRTPTSYANVDVHDDSFSEVAFAYPDDDAPALLAENLDVNSLDTGHLTFGTTYY